MRVFLDTNILLDILLNRTGFSQESASVVLRCEQNGFPMFIAWHGLATAYYLLRRGRTESEALQEVDKILAWAQVAASSDIQARRARTLGFSDFEDALQAVAAEACAVDCLITRNVKDFRLCAVPAMSPGDFLNGPLHARAT
jgi:predicted nucleic acid-binding protein